MNKPPEKVTNLNDARAARGTAPVVDARMADGLVASHLAGTGMQLNLIATYFTERGRPDLAEKIVPLSQQVSDLANDIAKSL